ncbi:hypothetical protein KY345_06805 [Candidatus Woesearchaeota archaeon]|nr:hypothetical protein [Candidatus Woesearchaeota archaeon]
MEKKYEIILTLNDAPSGIALDENLHSWKEEYERRITLIKGMIRTRGTTYTNFVGDVDLEGITEGVYHNSDTLSIRIPLLATERSRAKDISNHIHSETFHLGFNMDLYEDNSIVYSRKGNESKEKTVSEK